MTKNNQIPQKLSGLSYKHNIAFAASCCERLLPIYQAFVVVEYQRDSDVLRETLNQIWAFLEGKYLKEEYVHDMIRSCEKVIPSNDDYHSIFFIGAINAYAAIVDVLEFFLDRDSKHISNVINLTMDTIEQYVFAVNFPYMYPVLHTPAIDEWIRKSPLVEAELEKQIQDFEAIKSKTVLNNQYLEELRKSSGQVGIHPIKRGLVVENNTNR